MLDLYGLLYYIWYIWDAYLHVFEGVRKSLFLISYGHYSLLLYIQLYMDMKLTLILRI